MSRNDLDITPLEDGQASSSRFQKNWEADDRFGWRLDVVQHCRTGTLPFGRLVLRGSFNGQLTLAIEGIDE